MSSFQVAWSIEPVDAQPDDPGVALVELGLELGDPAELGRADGGEVGWMGEEDAPPVAEVLVEVDLPFRGISREVRCLVAELERHVVVLPVAVAGRSILRTRLRPTGRFFTL